MRQRWVKTEKVNSTFIALASAACIFLVALLSLALQRLLPAPSPFPLMRLHWLRMIQDGMLASKASFELFSSD